MNTDYIFKNKLIDEKNLLLDIVFLSVAIIIFSFFCLSDFKIIYSDNQKEESEKIIGVNMKGMYTSLNYERFPSIQFQLIIMIKASSLLKI
ncbi:MAG: hypothetical protein ACXWFZ_05090 [Nitrososphaeraceae archaeon]